MTEHVGTTDPDEASLHTAIAMMLIQRGWTLLSAQEVTRQAVDLLASSTFVAPAGAGLHIYATTLYRACAGLEGCERQERAYAELFHYLYDAARRFAHDCSEDIREELACQAIAEIFFRIIGAPDRRAGPVRNQGAFLAVAIQQLRNTIRRWRSLRTDGWLDTIETLEAGVASDPAAVVASQDLALRVQQCFRHTLSRYPCAKLQLYVVWMRQIEGLEYEAIAARLRTTVANARLLHARGVARLRSDPPWQSLGDEMGLLR